MLFPVRIHRVEEGHNVRFQAATLIERLSVSAKPLEEQLSTIEMAYEIAVAAAETALRLARKNAKADPRAFWFSVHELKQFTRWLNEMGYFLENENSTFARDMGVAEGSLRKMKAFYKRFPDIRYVDTTVSWSKYRNNKATPEGSFGERIQ